jgi:hypothetical protein
MTFAGKMKLAIAVCILSTACATASIPIPDKLQGLGTDTVFVRGFTVDHRHRKKILLVEEKESEGYTVSNTANYDGFYAMLSLSGRKLYLIGLETDVAKIHQKDGDEKVTTERAAVPLDEERVFASWFSGDLRQHHSKGVRILAFRRGILVSDTEMAGQTREANKSR